VRAIGHIRYEIAWIPRHIQGLPRPMNLARAMPDHMTSTMTQPEMVPSPTYRLLGPSVRNGTKMSIRPMKSLAYFVHTCRKSAPTAITPVVRCADWSSTRCRMLSTSRSVAISPTMIVTESDTKLMTPMK
jgi:hypothetical protein